MWGKPGEVTPFVLGVVVYELGSLRLQGNKMLVIKNHKKVRNHTNILERDDFSCVQTGFLQVTNFIC